MNLLAALAQTSGTTGPTPLLMIMFGALALVVALARLLRRLLGMLTRVLLSAGAAMTGLASMLALCTVLTTVLLLYVR